MEPQVQYVRSADGTNIAFYDIGEGVPLVISPNMWCHLTATWAGETRDATLRLVDEGFRIVRLDMRGKGLSDRGVFDFSLEAHAEDIEAIRIRLGLESFALLGAVHGTPPAMCYAIRHPDRVTHLILMVPFADGQRWYERTPTLGGLESFRAMGDGQWQLYMRTHAAALSGLLGVGDPEEMAAVMFQCVSQESLARYLAALRTYDLSGSLGAIRAPTLALNTGHELDTTSSQAVVAAIPNARLVRVPRGSLPFTVPTMSMAEHTVRFVLGREPRPHATEEPTAARQEPHATVIILFADIVDSTALTESMGDAAFRERARALDASLRVIISGAGGTAIDGKLLGDGVLATFPAASQAIGAALDCAAAGNEQSLPLHLGLHAGDVIREQNNVFGGAVNIASRISGLSAPGEVLVSDIVRGLARTSAGVRFEDRGEYELKGVTEPQRIYAVKPA